jgi:hypothetical protein
MRTEPLCPKRGPAGLAATQRKGFTRSDAPRRRHPRLRWPLIRVSGEDAMAQRMLLLTWYANTRCVRAVIAWICDGLDPTSSCAHCGRVGRVPPLPAGGRSDRVVFEHAGRRRRCRVHVRASRWCNVPDAPRWIGTDIIVPVSLVLVPQHVRSDDRDGCVAGRSDGRAGFFSFGDRPHHGSSVAPVVQPRAARIVFGSRRASTPRIAAPGNPRDLIVRSGQISHH